MTCPRGCCPDYKTHLKSLHLRPAIPSPKKTVDHTDQTVNTVTEHWDDRQDVNIGVLKPIQVKVKKEDDGA